MVAQTQVMNSRTALNLALFVIVAGLGLFVYFKPKAPGQSEFRLSTLQPADVRTIRIEKTGIAPIALQKRGAGWFITEPFPARTDALKIARVLEILSARSSQRFPSEDLARFDLDKPYAKLILEGQAFRFGALNSLTQEQYIASPEAVYLVELRYAAALPVRPEDLASRRLLAEDEAPTAFELEKFSLTQKEGKWSVLPAPNETPSQDDLNAWVKEWQHAHALHSRPGKRAKVTGQIKIKLASGKTLQLQIIQQEPEFILLRGDENIQYHFSKDIGKRLLSPPIQQK